MTVSQQTQPRERGATEVLAFRVPAEFKETLRRAASVRDGDNISRLIRRSVEETIKREQLLSDEAIVGDRGAA